MILAETGPVVSDVEIIGDVTASVWASSASTDGDVIVRMSQVTPSGRVEMIADGIRRGRFRNGRTAAEAMVPGEPALVEVDLGSVAFVLPAGHALRVAIQATSSTRFEPNPGTIDPIATATPVATTMTLYRDAAHPSAITVPVAAGAFPGMPPGLDEDAATGGAPEPRPRVTCGPPRAAAARAHGRSSERVGRGGDVAEAA